MFNTIINQSNPARPKQRKTKVLSEFITNYDEIGNQSIENMMNEADTPKFDYLKNQQFKQIIKKLFYYCNITNPLEGLFFITFAFISSLTIIIIDSLITNIFNYKQSLSLNYYENNNNNVILNFIIYITTSMIFGLIATSIGFFLSKESDGSGLPEIKSILSGISNKEFFSSSTLIAKVIGLIAIISSGLAVGRVGPYVHICCIICKQLLNFPLFTKIRNSISAKNNMLLAASTAGITLAIGTPLGGILFSLETSSTIYVVSNIWRNFLISVFCYFMSNFIQSISGLKLIKLNADFSKALKFEQEYLLVFVIAILCGLLSAMLNSIILKIHYWRDNRRDGSFFKGRFRYMMFVCLVVSCLNFSFLPLRTINKTVDNVLFTPSNFSSVESVNGFKGSSSSLGNEKNNNSKIIYKANNNTKDEDNKISNNSSHISFNHNSINNNDNSEENDSNDQFSISKKLINQLHHPNEGFILLINFIILFICIALSLTTNGVMDMFEPYTLLGALFGRLIGHMIKLSFDYNEEYFYSMLAAACMTSGGLHTVSSAIMIFELNGQTSYLVPLLIGCLISSLISQALSLNMNDVFMIIKNLPNPNSIIYETIKNLSAKNYYTNIAFYLKKNQDKSSSNALSSINNSLLHKETIKNDLSIVSSNTDNLNEININENSVSDVSNINKPHLLEKVKEKMSKSSNIITSTKNIFNSDFNNNKVIDLDNGFELSSKDDFSSSFNSKKFNEFNVISSLLLLFKLPEKYNSVIPVLNSKRELLFTFKAKNLLKYLSKHYTKKSKKKQNSNKSLVLNEKCKEKSNIDQERNNSSNSNNSDQERNDESIDNNNSNIISNNCEYSNKATLNIPNSTQQNTLIEVLNYLNKKYFNISKSKINSINNISETNNEYVSDINNISTCSTNSKMVFKSLLKLLLMKIKDIVTAIKRVFNKSNLEIEKYYVEELIQKHLYDLTEFSKNNKNSFLNDPINENYSELNVDYSAIIVDKNFPISKIQGMFNMLSISQIFVTGENVLVGAITKEEFINKAYIN